MSYACPMSFKLIDSNVSRLTSLFVSSLVIFYLYSSWSVILFFLVYDFMMRLFFSKKLSPLHMASQFIISFIKLEPKNIDSGAKRLAGQFGLLFVFLLIIGHYLAMPQFLYIVAGIFLACSLLDVFFNYCIGCKIYFIIKKIYPGFMS